MCSEHTHVANNNTANNIVNMFKSSFANEVVEDVRQSLTAEAEHETRLQEDLLGPAAAGRYKPAYRSQFAASTHGPLDNLPLLRTSGDLSPALTDLTATSDLGNSVASSGGGGGGGGGGGEAWHNSSSSSSEFEPFVGPGAEPNGGDVVASRFFNGGGGGGVHLGEKVAAGVARGGHHVQAMSFLDAQARVPLVRLKQVGTSWHLTAAQEPYFFSRK